MNGRQGVRQGWLVARRELRERARSRAFLASVALMVVTVAAILIVPAVLKPGGGTRDIGITGRAPVALAITIAGQARAAGLTARIHRYAQPAAGEQAVRQGHLAVLVSGAQRLEWQGQADQQLKAVVTGAIQLAVVR
jgi:ABC-2 type transport system permease protein